MRAGQPNFEIQPPLVIGRKSNDDRIVWERCEALTPEFSFAHQIFDAGHCAINIQLAPVIGRVLVPATLARHAGLDREVVVTGNYDHLELWNPPAWEKHLNAVEGSVEHAAERLAAHGS
jgi:hypothetical protein